MNCSLVDHLSIWDNNTQEQSTSPDGKTELILARLREDVGYALTKGSWRHCITGGVDVYPVSIHPRA